MEAGNKNERGEDTGRKERKRRTGGPRKEEGGTRESDRERAGQGVMGRGEKEGRKRDG